MAVDTTINTPEKRTRARDNYSDLVTSLLLKYYKNSGEKIAAEDKLIFEKEAEIDKVNVQAREDLLQRHCEWMHDNFVVSIEDCKKMAAEWSAREKKSGDKSVNILDFALSKGLNPRDAWGTVLK